MRVVPMALEADTWGLSWGCEGWASMESGQPVDGQETWRRRHGQKQGAGGREGVGSVLPSPGIPSQSPRGLRTCPGAGRRLNGSKLGPEKDVHPESSPRQPPRRSGPDGGGVSQAGQGSVRRIRDGLVPGAARAEGERWVPGAWRQDLRGAGSHHSLLGQPHGSHLCSWVE